MVTKRFSRRTFLRFAGLGAAALFVGRARVSPALEAAAASSRAPLAPAGQPVIELPLKQAATDTLEVNMRAVPSEVSILPGAPTRVWTYQASVVQGDPAMVGAVPESYLGPVIRVRKGQHLKVNFTNDLPQETTVHAHGPCIPSSMGGHPHPMDAVAANGGKRVYEYDILDRAAPFWFHPHPHQTTAYQVYQGLAGLLLVSDDVEAQMGLASGEYDIPIVLQDRTFDANNQLVYSGGGMAMMWGFLGNRIMVNGKPDYVLPVAPGTYRLRIYNGSQARIFKLAWQDSTPLTVIGTDGGFLPQPVQRQAVTLAPAERVDLWVDLTKLREGSEIVLQSLSFQAGMGMMGGGMMGGGRMMGGGMMGGQTSLPQGAAFPVLKIRVQGAAKAPLTLPATLNTAPLYQWQDGVNLKAPRTIILGMQHMTWTLNGRVFDLEDVAPDENIPFDKVEMWDIANQTMISHPMHIHNVQFNVIGRRSSAQGSAAYLSLAEGFVDGGWKDTVLVTPGERVRLLVKFTTYTGMFMYHCHILEHESMGMMRNLMVGMS